MVDPPHVCKKESLLISRTMLAPMEEQEKESQDLIEELKVLKIKDEISI